MSPTTRRPAQARRTPLRAILTLSAPEAAALALAAETFARSPFMPPRAGYLKLARTLRRVQEEIEQTEGKIRAMQRRGDR